MNSVFENRRTIVSDGSGASKNKCFSIKKNKKIRKAVLYKVIALKFSEWYREIVQRMGFHLGLRLYFYDVFKFGRNLPQILFTL